MRRVAKGFLATVLIAGFVVAAKVMLIQNMNEAVKLWKDGQSSAAARRLRVNAALGNTVAQEVLGKLYACGENMQFDRERSIYWYERAGQQVQQLDDSELKKKSEC